MGAWSGEPFGNDSAADWAWELEDASDWSPIRTALDEALAGDDPLDEEVATYAIAAAEVVAHGLGRATQEDPYTEEVVAFVKRAGAPPAELVGLAVAALTAATGPTSGLTELWEDPDEWRAANSRIEAALRA
jgi:hypothetical protein